MPKTNQPGFQYERPRGSDYGSALLAGLFALGLYLATLAPGVISLQDDTLEFQLVAQRAAIPHPTGYPLYAILLSLAARLIPVGEVAFRANLLSALLASGAVALSYLVARRLGADRLPALFGTLLFALSPTFWSQATVAEVYALHFLLLAAMLLTLLGWGTAGDQGEERGKSLPVLCALFLALGLAHHRTIILWLPGLLLYALLRLREGKRPLDPRAIGLKAWASLAAALLLPLLLYLWLPLRAGVGSIDGTYQEVGFSCWVMACQYGSFFADNPLGSARPPTFFAALTVAEVGWPALLLALAGLIQLWRLARARWALLVGGLTSNLLFAINYRVHDPEVFWLPIIWSLALLSTLGLQAGVERLSRPAAGHLLSGLALALLLVRGASILPSVDRSNLQGPPLFEGEPFNGRDVLAQPLPANAAIIGLLGEISYLRYLQEAEQLRPEVESIALPADPVDLRYRAVEQLLAKGGRPFLTRPLPGAGERWSLTALGPLVEVLPEPRTSLPEGLWPLSLSVTEEITLAAWTRSPIPGSHQERLTLAWQVGGVVEEPLHVSTRLLDAAGNVLASVDRAPLNGAYPTPFWRPGEIILDTYPLPAPPADARYLIILYRLDESKSEVGRAEWKP